MNDQHGITDELTTAVDQLHASLAQAADAAGRIRSLLPRIARISTVFDELESILESSRRGAASGPAAGRARPALIAPAAAPPRTMRKAAVEPEKEAERAEAAGTPQPPAWNPAPAVAAKTAAPMAASEALSSSGIADGVGGTIPEIADADGPVTSFRLEFESTHGPLDLRAIDDAVGEHAAVRDVALLDYDGRRATLKVWVTANAEVAEVQQALTARAAELAAPGSSISIIALEDVA